LKRYCKNDKSLTEFQTFQNKQLEKIQKINVTSEDDLNNLLNEDVATCCPRRKRKSIVKPVPAPVKRPSMNGGYTTVQPPAKRPNLQPPPKTPVRVPVLNTYQRPGPAQSKTGPPGKKNDEIVCTPDILGLFNDNDDSAIPTTNMMPSTSLAPPPLVMRNNQRQIRAAAPTPTPIYVSLTNVLIKFLFITYYSTSTAQRQWFSDRLEPRCASGNLPIAKRKANPSAKAIRTASSIHTIPSRNAVGTIAARPAIHDTHSKCNEQPNIPAKSANTGTPAFQFAATNALHIH
jgi:hypothetical protein